MNLKWIHGKQNKPFQVRVRRKNGWHKISSGDLLPGDICLIERAPGASNEEMILPCDMLLVHGHAIVNESLLTGESTPQLKEPVVSRSPSECLNMDLDKIHILFGGTKLIQASSSEPFPFHGTSPTTCTAYVLRTGFETVQGNLMRSMYFNQDRKTVNNLETYVFIAFLMMVSCASALHVWRSADQDRDPWKLLVDCLLIIASSIPAELPMQLSLAVLYSQRELQKDCGMPCLQWWLMVIDLRVR